MPEGPICYCLLTCGFIQKDLQTDKAGGERETNGRIEQNEISVGLGLVAGQNVRCRLLTQCIGCRILMMGLSDAILQF